ncbi:MAG: hypothetical protein PHP25_00370 [Candidatus Moranbacteria bacterium]|nr:hypothetical protein [Candidatus Moranbacteria bacterium]
MAKLNGFAKIGGRLLEHPGVYEHMRKNSEKYSLVVLPGGGHDINEHFRKMGWDIDFGPMGRKMKTFRQRQAARDILELNQLKVQDQLDKFGVSARVMIPIRYAVDVLCPENGDVTTLSVYNGFHRLWVYTSEETVEKKKLWLKQLAACFNHIAPGELDKIEVVGVKEIL